MMQASIMSASSFSANRCVQRYFDELYGVEQSAK